MSDGEKQEFREKLKRDIKRIKKMLYMEELKSFFSAVAFAANAACLAMFPFTFISLLNIAALIYCAKQFKPTVKQQISYAEQLKLLTTIKKDKVWTQSDK